MLSDTVGPVEVLHTTPLDVTEKPLSVLTLPPLTALSFSIADTGVVITSANFGGAGAGPDFLQAVNNVIVKIIVKE